MANNIGGIMSDVRIIMTRQQGIFLLMDQGDLKDTVIETLSNKEIADQLSSHFDAEIDVMESN